MKKLLAIALAALILTGCTTRTEYGPCVGINDSDRDPALKYKIDTWNVILGIVFVESIVVPVVIALDELYCPIGKK